MIQTLPLRHLLDVEDWSATELANILNIAREMREARNQRTVSALLRDATVITLFYENSTRTRTSFELAAKILGANVINITASSSSVAKGETIQDTFNTLDAMGPNVIVMRHDQSGAAETAAQWSKSSIINAGDGWHAHPSQAMLDLLTLTETMGNVRGKTITIVGDILHSRVARSNIWSLTTMGARVILCGPPTLLPAAFARAYPGRNVSVMHHIEDALAESDAVMALRIQKERMTGGLLPSLREYREQYGLTVHRMRAYPDMPVLHPGPMNEGIEIDPSIAHGHQSLVEHQVANGVPIRMGILLWVTRKRNLAKHTEPVEVMSHV